MYASSSQSLVVSGMYLLITSKSYPLPFGFSDSFSHSRRVGKSHLLRCHITLLMNLNTTGTHPILEVCRKWCRAWLLRGEKVWQHPRISLMMSLTAQIKPAGESADAETKEKHNKTSHLPRPLTPSSCIFSEINFVPFTPTPNSQWYSFN